MSAYTYRMLTERLLAETPKNRIGAVKEVRRALNCNIHEGIFLVDVYKEVLRIGSMVSSLQGYETITEARAWYKAMLIKMGFRPIPC